MTAQKFIEDNKNTVKQNNYVRISEKSECNQFTNQVTLLMQFTVNNQDRIVGIRSVSGTNYCSAVEYIVLITDKMNAESAANKIRDFFKHNVVTAIDSNLILS